MADEADVDSDAEIHSVGEVRPQGVHQCSCSSPVLEDTNHLILVRKRCQAMVRRMTWCTRSQRWLGWGRLWVRFFGSCGVDFFLWLPLEALNIGIAVLSLQHFVLVEVSPNWIECFGERVGHWLNVLVSIAGQQMPFHRRMRRNLLLRMMIMIIRHPSVGWSWFPTKNDAGECRCKRLKLLELSTEGKDLDAQTRSSRRTWTRKNGFLRPPKMIEDMHWGYHLQGDIGLWFTPGGLNKALKCLTCQGFTHMFLYKIISI